jgi:hypothetical protein
MDWKVMYFEPGRSHAMLLKGDVTLAEASAWFPRLIIVDSKNLKT